MLHCILIEIRGISKNIAPWNSVPVSPSRDSENLATARRASGECAIKPAFHDADTDILARILADTSDTDTRDFLKLFHVASRTTRRHSRDDPREDVGVGVGVVECGLNQRHRSVCCL